MFRKRLHPACLTLVAILASGCGGGGGSGGSSGGGSSGSGGTVTAPATLTIHYRRTSNAYTGWGVHIWNDTSGPAAVAAGTTTTWPNVRPFDTMSGDWVSTTIPLVNANANLNFLVHNNGGQSPMMDIAINRSTFGGDVWVVQDTTTVYATQAAADAAVARVGSQSSALDLSTVAVGSTASALPAGWNRRAQFMEIFVRSFQDSDGDGHGDINGLINRLDYLKGLGVTGLWLMPVYKSQDGDHGYAVSDYRAIDPRYGTLADFDRLITEAHARGIGIVLDYVPNHAAAHNPLFLDAVSSTGNARRNWFNFNASNPGWTGFNGANWHNSGTGYYYGVFASSMADFNLRNPEVIAFHQNNLRFWLNRGVDGFRMDAVETLIENGASAYTNQPENHAILNGLKTAVSAYQNRYFVCEAPDHPTAYAAPASCGKAFAFGRQWDVRNSATTGRLASGLAGYLSDPQRSELPLFISNHDGFAGLRPYPDLAGNGEGDYRVAAALEILTSDTPFAYYGEEVGMAGNGQTGDANVRAPMSWSDNATTAGFTTGTPYRSLATNRATHNASVQAGVTTSLLETYRALYRVRTDYPALATGAITPLSVTNDSHVSFLRTEGGSVMLVVINLSAANATVTLDTGVASGTFTPVWLGATLNSNAAGRLSVPMNAKNVMIFNVTR